MKIPPRTAARFVRFSLLSLGLAASFLLPSKALAAFGLTNSGGYYTVDTGASLVFKVRQSDAELTSMVYNGTECQNQTSGKSGHLASGFGGSASVSASISGDYITVTCNGTISGDAATQYYIAKRGTNTIYMDTYAGGPIGELRWITIINNSATTIDPGMAARTASANAVIIESSDVYAEPDGTTRSKYFASSFAKDLSIEGRSGGGIGIYMAYGSRESSGGGPFYRDIQSSPNVVYHRHLQRHNQR